MSSDQIDVEISKRHNSRTTLGPDLNQSGNQSENYSSDWRNNYGRESQPVYKILRKHRLTKLSSKYQKIYTDDESQSSENSLKYLHEKKKRMRKKIKGKKYITIDKEPKRNDVSNSHPEVNNKVRENFRQIEDTYCDRRKPSHPNKTSVKNKRNKRMEYLNCEKYDHPHNVPTLPYTSNGYGKDMEDISQYWVVEEEKPALNSNCNDDNYLVPQQKMRISGNKMQNLRNSLVNSHTSIGLSNHQHEKIYNDKVESNYENFSGNLYRQLVNSNSEHVNKPLTASYDNARRESGCGRFQNRNVNTNIEEQTFIAQNFQPYNLYPKQCDSSDNNIYYSSENQRFYGYSGDPKGIQDRCNLPYEDLNIDKSQEEIQEPESEYAKCNMEANTCLSENECRQFYEVPDRELYGVWSTTIDIQRNDSVINPMQTIENHSEIEPRMQVPNQKSPANELDTTTDRQYLKSFEKDGQTLFYVESGSHCAQFNCNQNHELEYDTHHMSSKQVNIHEAGAHFVNNENPLCLSSPIVTDSISDISDGVVSDNVSTLVASATGSEMNTSDDNTVVALSES